MVRILSNCSCVCTLDTLQQDIGLGLQHHNCHSVVSILDDSLQEEFDLSAQPCILVQHGIAAQPFPHVLHFPQHLFLAADPYGLWPSMLWCEQVCAVCRLCLGQRTTVGDESERVTFSGTGFV